MLERTSPLENRWFQDEKPSTKKGNSKPKKSDDDGTPKTLVRPSLNSVRLVTAEEVLANDGPDDWTKLADYMKTRVVGRPERARSEPMRIDSALNVSKKRKRHPSPE